MRKGGTDLIMYDRKSTSAKNKAANRVNYMELGKGVQYKEVANGIVQVVATDDGKQGTIKPVKVDVKKFASTQHKAVEKDIDKETAVARMLYEET